MSYSKVHASLRTDPHTNNIHNPQAEGNLRVESENTIEPPVTEDLTRMGYVDRCDQMATSRKAMK
jgi:hypothetical protein